MFSVLIIQSEDLKAEFIEKPFKNCSPIDEQAIDRLETDF